MAPTFVASHKFGRHPFYILRMKSFELCNTSLQSYAIIYLHDESMKDIQSLSDASIEWILQNTHSKVRFLSSIGQWGSGIYKSIHISKKTGYAAADEYCTQPGILSCLTYLCVVVCIFHVKYQMTWYRNTEFNARYLGCTVVLYWVSIGSSKKNLGMSLVVSLITKNKSMGFSDLLHCEFQET